MKKTKVMKNIIKANKIIQINHIKDIKKNIHQKIRIVK